MKQYDVPFSYEMYGRITVEAKNEREALEKAEERLAGMSVSEMADASSYLEDSEAIDRDGHIIMFDPDMPVGEDAENTHLRAAMYIVKAYVEACFNDKKHPEYPAPIYELIKEWAKEIISTGADIEKFISLRFKGTYGAKAVSEPPYDSRFTKLVNTAMYIEEAYIRALLYGEGVNLLDGMGIDPEGTFITWAREYDGQVNRGSVIAYAYKRMAEVPGATSPITFTVEEYVEDWRTRIRKEKVVERHKIEAPTYFEAFKKAYPYERQLRYCSGHYMRIAEQDMHRRYRDWCKNGLTIEDYYGNGVVD